MDDPENYISGVTMDGTEFDFEALCSSLSTMRMNRMVIHWLFSRLKKENPDRQFFTPSEYQTVFLSHQAEVIDLIKKRYPTVQRDTVRTLRSTFGLIKENQRSVGTDDPDSPEVLPS